MATLLQAAQPEDEKLLGAVTTAIVDAVDPDEIILFGSRARKEHRPDSDYDFLVVVPDSRNLDENRLKLSGDLYIALMPFRIPKDILLYSASEAASKREDRWSVVRRSYNEGRRLYAR